MSIMARLKKEIVAEILKGIEKRDGNITPQAVIDIARSEESPIHVLFEWDNSVAADNWRLWQARKVIASVKVEWMGRETDAYWNAKVELDGEPVQAYYSTEKVMSNEDIYQDILKTAVAELKYWHNKYKEIKELKGLIDEEILQSFQIS